VAAALALAWSVSGEAQTQTPTQTQTPPGTPGRVTKENLVKAKMTIEAIDPTTRTLTLKNDEGEADTFKVGPEMKRFDELKVGDKVNVSYYESLVFDLRKPGEPSVPTTTTAGASKGAESKLPAGAVGAQQTMTVTVKAVDMNVPSITVDTADGRTVTRKIKDRKNLQGVSVGDRIDITYTQALLMNVERAK
jgi:hypothetical protein